MAASDHLQERQFFHGTTAKLQPGDMIEPGRPKNFAGSLDGKVYFTPHVESARDYAFALGGFSDPPSEHTYRVEPTGPHELDPEGIGSFVRPSLQGSRMSGHPLRVVGEV